MKIQMRKAHLGGQAGVKELSVLLCLVWMVWFIKHGFQCRKRVAQVCVLTQGTGVPEKHEGTPGPLYQPQPSGSGSWIVLEGRFS